MLVLVTPAGLDKFFEEMGETGTDPSSPPAPQIRSTLKDLGPPPRSTASKL